MLQVNERGMEMLLYWAADVPRILYQPVSSKTSTVLQECHRWEWREQKVKFFSIKKILAQTSVVSGPY